MGLYDRDYTRESRGHAFRSSPQMRMSFPRITPVVKWLLIINIAIFFLEILLFPNNVPVQVGQQIISVNVLEKWFSVFPSSLIFFFQLWRLITYQFLHGGIGHLLFNMLGLFFLGPTLERHWGSKRFLKFYLGCGVAGGLFYPLLVAAGFLVAGPMIGASGAILGMLAACAILFPHFVVFFFLFPVPIRVAAIILTLLYSANLIMAGANAGGDAAHLAGMAAGAVYVFSGLWRAKLKSKLRSDRMDKQTTATTDLQAELDRILQKVHQSGIHSLTSKERKTLKRITELERMHKKSQS